MQYLAVLERGANGWGAYVPDLPIILATGATREEVERRVREAVELYLEELRTAESSRLRQPRKELWSVPDCPGTQPAAGTADEHESGRASGAARWS